MTTPFTTTTWESGATKKRLIALLSLGILLLSLHTVSAPSVFTLSLNFTPASPHVSQLVTFDATGSSSSAGQIVSYTWDFGDGFSVTNCAGKLGCANATTTHAYSAPGSFSITLTAVDNTTSSSSLRQSLFISPTNQPPTAAFSFVPARPVVLNTTSFDASASSDLDGFVAVYNWTFGDGSLPVQATTPMMIHTYDAAGVYNVSLTVKDNGGATGFTSKNVTVVASDLHPIANFTVSPITPLTGENTTFNASASTDPDIGGAVTSYFWNFGDGTSQAGGALTAHTYLSPGRYVAMLTVADNSGLVNSTFRQFQVQPGPPPLKISLGSDQTSGESPLDVQFNATAIGGQGPYTFSWDFGDGQTATGAYPGHTYTSAGTYQVKVVTTDAMGHTVSNSTSITVSAPRLATIGPFPVQYLLYGVGGSIAALLVALLLYTGFSRRGKTRKKTSKEDDEYG